MKPCRRRYSSASSGVYRIAKITNAGEPARKTIRPTTCWIRPELALQRKALPLGIPPKLADTFGSFLAEGALAAAYRLKHIEPFFHAYNELVLDFTGVRNINSSFANALIVPLIEQHGEEALKKLRFHGCNAVVRVMIESALTLGVERNRGSNHRELA